MAELAPIASRIGPTPEDLGQDPTLRTDPNEVATARWWKAEYGLTRRDRGDGHAYRAAGPGRPGAGIELTQDPGGIGPGAAHPIRPVLGHAHSMAPPGPLEHEDGDRGTSHRRGNERQDDGRRVIT